MEFVEQLILSHLPGKTRISPQGWILMNAPCCHHRGHRPDTRMRGNLYVGTDHHVGFNCYNCGFKFRFDGTRMSHNFSQWLTWMGVDHAQVQHIKMLLMNEHMQGDITSMSTHEVTPQHWPPVPLPEGAESMISLSACGCQDPLFVDACNYIHSRGSAIAEGYDYYYSTHTRHQLCHRVILPMWHAQQIVGWTARYVGSPPQGVPRYYNSSVPQGYLFNQDILELPRSMVLVVEGPFDAIAVQGVSALGSTLSEHQIHNLLRTQKQIVILPDRQRKNQGLIDVAITFGWHVSFPDWEPHIKDAADACVAYGQLYTITSALAARTSNAIEIGVRRQMLGTTT